MPIAWTPAEIALLDSLRSPEEVQDYLDAIPYNDEITCRSPRRVMRDRKAHCMEGALFAAAALEHLGHPPRVVDLRAERDDDHILAIFRVGNGLGALAKSNYTGIRYRSPVYRSLRELVMSYFEDYFNPSGEQTLRGYTRPLRLTSRLFGAWQTREDELDEIGDHFDRMDVIRIVTAAEAERLRPVPPYLYEAGLLGANPKGLYGLHDSMLQE
ncbi:MAG TPA: hypothetical protein VFQ38_00035 [Longimicrobiales bacterium]|nr:hypothetical protein [Longimicrobiales bacterium]